MTILLTWWIPIKTYRRSIRNILLMGPINYWRTRRTDRTRTFKHTLGVVAIMKNEGPYIKEWLDYHIAAGVDMFYLYDNDSDDNTTEILAPYIKRGIVELTHISGEKRQNDAYIDAIKRHRNDMRWMARIDLDEFIVTPNHDHIMDFINSIPGHFSQIIMTWVCYGNSGHITAPHGLVIENYKHHETHFHGIKSIANPRMVVRQSNPHQVDVAGFTVDENGRHLGRINQTNNPPPCKKIRCNHYVTKSYQEFRDRCLKGGGSGGREYGMRKLKRFDVLNTNDVYDDVMDRWIVKIKNETTNSD